MLSMHEKISTIRKEFAEMDINHDEYLTQEEFYNAMDKKIGKEFDRNVAQQLFERMDKDYDNRISIDEFIKVFLEAEEILKNKIDNSKKYLEDYHRQRREAAQKLEEMRNTERMNNYGIMEGSTLNVNVQEAQDLKESPHSQGSTDAYCQISVGVSQQQTRVSHSASPVWNESFSFPIENGSEELFIAILDYESFQKNDIISKVSIPLNNLKDQNKHDEWFYLQDKNGGVTKGRIHLVLQWVHSRVKYLKDVVQKWDEHIRLQQEDLIDYERDLAILYEPFTNLMKLYRGDKEKPEQVPNNQLGKSTKEYLALPIAFNQQEIKNVIKDNRSMVATAVFLFIAVFVCFNRAVYLDIMIGSYFIYLFFTKTATGQHMKFLAIGVGFSMLIDLVWLILFSKYKWIAEGYRVEYTLEMHLNRFVIAFSYLIFFFKIPLAFFYFTDFKTLTQDSQGSNNANIRQAGVQNTPENSRFNVPERNYNNPNYN